MAQQKLFPGYDVPKRTLAIGAAGSLETKEDLDFGDRVRIEVVARVTKVAGHGKPDEEGDYEVAITYGTAVEDHTITKLEADQVFGEVEVVEDDEGPGA